MNERSRRLKTIESDLMDIYVDLFGVKYIPGLQNNEKTEFNRIVEAFRQRIYNVKALQQQRDKKESKKGYKPSVNQIRINQDIRDDIKQCQNILQEAIRRIKVQVKDKPEAAIMKITASRQATIKNCEELLQDVLQSEQRGSYRPPQVHKTMQDLKRQKRMANQEDQEMINIQDIKKFEQYNKKDQELDEGLDEIIKLNRAIKDRLKDANQKIDETDNKIKQNLLRGQKVDQQIKKATSRLKQVIKEYRRPNKLCLNITMLLLFLALIGVIINLIKNTT